MSRKKGRSLGDKRREKRQMENGTMENGPAGPDRQNPESQKEYGVIPEGAVNILDERPPALMEMTAGARTRMEMPGWWAGQRSQARTETHGGGIRISEKTSPLEYRCDRCGKTTLIMRLRKPITVLGVRVGEPGSLKHCTDCDNGTPWLVENQPGQSPLEKTVEHALSR